MRGDRRRWTLSLPVALAMAAAATVRAGDPPTAPPPASPAPSPTEPRDPEVRTLMERLRAMEAKLERVDAVEAKLERVTREKEDLSRQVQDLTNRLNSPSPPPAVADDGLAPWEAAGRGGSPPRPGARTDEEGPADEGLENGGSGFSRGGQLPAGPQAGVPGGRRLGKLPITVRYDFDRFGLLFATDDDELTMKVNLLTQVDSRIYSPAGGYPTTSGWYVPRSRIHFTGRLTKPVAYHLSFQDSNGGGLQLLNAFLDFARDERFQVRVGRFKTPYTYEFYKIPIPELYLPERSIFNVNYQGNRQIGAMAWGEVFDRRLEYAVGPFNGPRNSYRDFNSTPDVFAFVNVTPFLKSEAGWLRNLNVGGSVDWGVQDNPIAPATLRTNQQTSTDTPTSVSAAGAATVPFLAFNSNVRERGVRELWELHTAYFYKGLSLIASWDAGFDSYATAGGKPVAVPVGGYSVHLAYLLTGETINDNSMINPLRPFDLRPGHFGLGAIQPTARYSTISLGNQVFTAGFSDPSQWTNHVQMTDVGFNWYLNKWVKLYFDWEHAMFASPVVIAPGRAQAANDLFWFRFQFFY